MINRRRTPILLVISAPSGAGKTTLCHTLMGEFDDLIYSVSCTTRKPRPSEVDGKSYHFMSEEDFLERIEDGKFLEYARVYDNWYGTLRQTVLEGFDRGVDVLMDLDTQGAATIRKNLRAAPEEDPIRRGFVDLFIAPPSITELERRLRGRGQDSEDVIRKRLAAAEAEMACWRDYQYVIINDELTRSYESLRSVLLAERLRVRAVS